MAIESDKLVAPPTPPPPRPAARREAIDAALRKFDGIEDVAPAPARKSRWASMDRRSMGALATAAVVAAISIPVALMTLRDVPRPPASPKLKTPYEEQAPAAASDNLAQVEPVTDQVSETATAEPAPTAPAQATALKAKDERMGLVADEPKAAREDAAPASIVAAAPPPPPPPPAPAPAPQYTSEAQDMVVTGSRIPQPNLESGANRQAKATSPLVTMDAYGEFLTGLQRALKSDNRRAVGRMVGFPLTVNLKGRAETYRSRREVESDFDKIFTPAVKAEVLSQKPYSLRSRADGKLKGAQRIWFSPACFDAACTSAGPIRIREVTP